MIINMQLKTIIALSIVGLMALMTVIFAYNDGSLIEFTIGVVITVVCLWAIMETLRFFIEWLFNKMDEKEGY